MATETTCPEGSTPDLEEVINRYENLIAENPHNPEYHKELGNAFHRTGQYDLALEEYRTALHIDNKYYPAQYNMGNTYFVTDSFHQAIIAWQKAFIMNRQLEHSIYNIAFTYYKLGTLEEDQERRRKLLDDAVLEFKTAIAMRPENTDTHLHLGLTWFELDRYEDAIHEYKEVIRIDPNDLYAHYNLGNVYYELGQEDTDYFEMALSEYQLSIQTNPEDLKSKNNIADCLLRLGKAQEALSEIDRVIEENTDYIPARCTRGEILASMNKHEDAIQEFDKVIQLNPEENALLHRYASQKLIEQYQFLILRHPLKYHIHYDLGRAYRDLGVAYQDRTYFLKARDEFRKAIDKDGTKLPYHLELGETFLRLNNTDSALLEMERCLAIDPSSIAARTLLSEIFLLSGERERACQELAQIRRLLTSSQNRAAGPSDVSEGGHGHPQHGPSKRKTAD